MRDFCPRFGEEIWYGAAYRAKHLYANSFFDAARDIFVLPRLHRMLGESLRKRTAAIFVGNHAEFFSALGGNAQLHQWLRLNQPFGYLKKQIRTVRRHSGANPQCGTNRLSRIWRAKRRLDFQMNEPEHQSG